MNRELRWSEILDEIRDCNPPEDEWDDDDGDADTESGGIVYDGGVNHGQQ